MTDHDQWDELAAGYALHALEPDDEVRFDEHLRTCADCRATLAEHELVAAQLGSIAYDADESEDAPSWSSIRAGIVGDAPVSLDERRRSRRKQPWILGAAAAVVAALAAALIVTQTTGSSTPASTRAIASCRHMPGCSVVPLHAAKG